MVCTPRWAITPKDHPFMETCSIQAAGWMACLKYDGLPFDVFSAARQ